MSMRRFFISSVEDSVLERRAALESLCFGIGFGRLELNCNYYFYFTVLCFYIVLYICICLPYDFFGNQTAAHTVEKVCAAASLAIPSLHGLSSSIVQLVAELSLTFKSVWLKKRLYVNPGFRRPLSRIRCYNSLGSTYVLSSGNVLMRFS